MKDWKEEFDNHVSEVRKDLGTEEVYYFGYKTLRDNELFTVPDWGNIKKFISSLLEQQRREFISDLRLLRGKVKQVSKVNELIKKYEDSKNE